jgi:hypothetical protein
MSVSSWEGNFEKPPHVQEVSVKAFETALRVPVFGRIATERFFLKVSNR